MLGIGSWFTSAKHSTFIQAYLPWLANFFMSIGPISMILMIIGAIVIAFGMFWGRWLFAIILGVFFAVAVYVISFWG